MSPKEAAHLRATEERLAVRREEGSAARPLVREIATESEAGAPAPSAGPNSEADAKSVEARGSTRQQNLDELERAAENILPSWHGAEVEAPAAPNGLHPAGSVPDALPPPPVRPSFSSFPIEQRAPLYSADTTIRTATVLPQRLAELLSQPQIAHASHWLSARPWAIAGLTVGAVILLALLIWPSAPDASQQVASKAPASAQHRAPLAPATAPAASAPSAEAPPPAAAEPAAAQPRASGAPVLPATSAKKKRAGRAASKPSAPKARKPAKTVGAPAR